MLAIASSAAPVLRNQPWACTHQAGHSNEGRSSVGAGSEGRVGAGSDFFFPIISYMKPWLYMLSYDAFRQLFAFPKRCSPYGNMYLHMLYMYYMCIVVTNFNGARRWGMHAKPPAREDGAPAAGVGVT